MSTVWQGQPTAHRAEQVEVKSPSSIFQAASEQATSRPYSGEWRGCRAGGKVFVTSPPYRGPSAPAGLHHYKGLHQTLPLRFAKHPQDMVADAMTLTPLAVAVP